MPDIFHKERLRKHRALIIEMIDASMQKAREKGPHPLTPGCRCIVCVNRRKKIVAGSEEHWKYRI